MSRVPWHRRHHPFSRPLTGRGIDTLSSDFFRRFFPVRPSSSLCVVVSGGRCCCTRRPFFPDFGAFYSVFGPMSVHHRECVCVCVELLRVWRSDAVETTILVFRKTRPKHPLSTASLSCFSWISVLKKLQQRSRTMAWWQRSASRWCWRCRVTTLCLLWLLWTSCPRTFGALATNHFRLWLNFVAVICTLIAVACPSLSAFFRMHCLIFTAASSALSSKMNYSQL